MDREQFLQSRWHKYPTSSQQETIKGRLFKSYNFENESWVVITNGKSHEISLPVMIEEFQSTKELDQIQFLTEGDWVEILSQSPSGTLIRLLSPCTLKGDKLSQLIKKAALIQNPKNPIDSFRNFIFNVEKWFIENHFKGVTTPTLVDNPGTEPFLDLFQVDFKMGSKIQKKYLPTSPELHLKKSLALGYQNIFEIRPCFRNNESSPTHQPEFLMCEWYRTFVSLEKIQEDILDLICHFDPKTNRKSVTRKTMAELFQNYLGFELTPKTTAEDLHAHCLKLNLTPPPNSDFDDLFYFLYVEKIERELKNYQLLFITDYPPSQAALARLNKDGWGDRFEFYINGVEIANAFHELNDPQIQRLRSQEDLNKKLSIGKIAPVLDEDFFEHLEFGMPPSSGVALGLDRLYMQLYNVADIHQLRLFPY